MHTPSRLNPLSRALLMRHALRKPVLAAMGLAFMLPLASQVQAQEIEFNIPKQSLANALNEWGRQSNLQLLFSPEDVQGKTSTAVHGKLTPAQAAAQLLKGTGIGYSLQGDTLTLSVAGSSSAINLGATTIGAQALGTTTEDTHSYTTGAVTIGKSTQTLRETPQSVTVMTRQLMDDKNLTTLDQVMAKTPGLTFSQRNYGAHVFQSRGFVLGEDSFLMDGVPGQAYTITGWLPPDMAIYDRVEVLRGPSGLYQGSGEPGGTINVVRKRALGTFGMNGEFSAGSWDNYHSSVDVTGPLNADGSLRGRFVTAYEDNQSWVDHAENQRPTIYGRLEYDITPSTTLSLGGTYQKNRSTPAFGLPAYADGKLLDVSRSTFVDAKWNELDERVWEGFAEVDHALDNGGQFKTSLTYRDAETPTRNFTWSDDAVDPATGDSWAVAYSYYTHIKSLGLDSFVTLPVEAFGRTHEFTVGGEYQHLNKDFTYGGGDYFPINVFDPDSIDIPKQKYVMDNGTWSTSRQYGLYGRAKIAATDELDVILGSRVTWFESEGKNANAYFNQFGETETNIDRKFIPYGALVYKLTPELSAYASYTKVFKPQTDIDASGSVIAPREGEQYELGLKREFLDGRMNGSLAMFRIYDENRAELVSGGQFYRAQGKVRSQGWETELSGNITDNWSVVTGYAYTMTRALSGADDGSTFSTITPKHNFNLWTDYQFSEGPLQDFSVGGGVRAVSATYYRRNVDFEQGGYATTSAQIGYKVNKNVSVKLTGNNLFDRKYYERVDSPWGSNFYGEPRNFTFTVRASY